MSEDQLSGLLDRAVHHAPPMEVSADDLLAAGKGRVRRRRAVGTGGAVGAAALVAALWGGLAGGNGTLLGTSEIQPATTVWEQGETVEGTLFAGLQTIDDDQVAHSYAAQLSRPSDGGPVTLVLSDKDVVVEEIPAQAPVPGLEVFAGERMTVAVWVEPDGVQTSVPLVGPRDPGGSSDVQHADIGGTTVAFSVWAGDVVALPEQVLDVYLVGRADVAALSGTQVQWVSFGSDGHRAKAFADESRGIVGYALDGQDAMLEQLGDRPAQVSSSYVLTEDGTETTVVVLPQSSEIEGLLADTDGAKWVGTRVLDRPVVLVVREAEDVGADPPVVTFVLGGESYDLDTYLEDLSTLHLPDGSAFSVDGEASSAEGISLRHHVDGERVPLTHDGDGDGDGPATALVPGGVVAAATGWDAGPAVLSDSRLELSDGTTTRWVTPTDVAQVPLDDGTLVTVLSVPAEAGVQVTGVGRARGGDVQRWDAVRP